MSVLNNLVFTAADYKFILSITGGGVYPLKTMDNFSYNDSSENEDIYAVGQEDPIANKSNANKYSGSFSIQNGELGAILALEGLASGIRIRNAVIAIAALEGVFTKVYSGVNINTDAVDVKAKDKQSVSKMDWNAVKVGK